MQFVLPLITESRRYENRDSSTGLNDATGNFDCDAIDTRAKQYDRENFRKWREAQRAAGTYEETMARVYSGFDRLCIEDIVPWAESDERVIEAWLEA